MPFEMVLNELSLQITDNRYVARQWMEMFVKTMIEASKKGVSGVLHTKSDFMSIYLSSDYPLKSWLNDNEVNPDVITFLLTIMIQYPYLYNRPEFRNEVLGSEFCYEGKPSEGLGVANILDALAVSLPSEKCWNSALLILEASYLTDDNDIQKKNVQVYHASQPYHIEAHSKWIVRRLQQDVKDGIDLWERRNELFPSLIFCESLLDRIQNLNYAEFQPIIRRLFELENYCKEMTGGFEPDKLYNARPETNATLNKYRDERTFICPDGIKRVFRWHVSVLDAWRIYFEPLPDNKKMIIGYIGRHLKTVKFN